MVQNDDLFLRIVDLLGFNERMATSSIIFTSGAVLLQTAVPFYLLTLTNIIGSASGYKLTTIVSCFTNEANDTAKSQVAQDRNYLVWKWP